MRSSTEALFRRIEHGDEKHRAWLHAELEKWDQEFTLDDLKLARKIADLAASKLRAGSKQYDALVEEIASEIKGSR